MTRPSRAPGRGVILTALAVWTLVLLIGLTLALVWIAGRVT